jgi:dTMP kinase
MPDKIKGKLIVIEGPDGCGKQTQAEKLFDRFKLEGHNVRKVTFPDYESHSSALVKMYLKGDFGGEPSEVNPYAAATFYAVDRFASFSVSWGKWYQEGDIIIADRYATSNMAHQAVKISDASEQEKFLEWLWDLEFVKFSLPVPDIVIFLDLPPKHSLELISQRNAKTSGTTSKDIHEKNAGYLKAAYQSYQLASQKYGWTKINCAFEGGIRSIDDIHNEIYVAATNKV